LFALAVGLALRGFGES